jgi:hypothetical protein
MIGQLGAPSVSIFAQNPLSLGPSDKKIGQSFFSDEKNGQSQTRVYLIQNDQEAQDQDSVRQTRA